MNTYKWIIECDEATHSCLFGSQFLLLQPQALNQSIILYSQLFFETFKKSGFPSSFAAWKVRLCSGQRRYSRENFVLFSNFYNSMRHFLSYQGGVGSVLLCYCLNSFFTNTRISGPKKNPPPHHRAVITL